MKTLKYILKITHDRLNLKVLLAAFTVAMFGQVMGNIAFAFMPWWIQLPVAILVSFGTMYAGYLLFLFVPRRRIATKQWNEDNL